MAPDDEPVEVDPEVLSDPVDGDLEDTAAVVPASRAGLVPTDPFRKYLREIQKYPPLTREEEQGLARRYRETGDRDALFRLVTANLFLVVRIALSFRRAARNVLDLVQEGNVGLMQAIERFDPELGVRLPTYAAWWIRAYMIKFLLDNVRLVRVGTTNARRKLLRNLSRERARLEERGFEVGPRLLAEHFGVSEQDVVEVQKAIQSHDVSLDAPVGDDSTQVRGDFLPSKAVSIEDEVARRQLQERVERVIAEFRAGLDDRDRTLLDDRIVAEDPQTLRQIGDRFGVTREAVRQSEARLLQRLRLFLEDRLGDSGVVRVDPAHRKARN